MCIEYTKHMHIPRRHDRSEKRSYDLYSVYLLYPFVVRNECFLLDLQQLSTLLNI